MKVCPVSGQSAAEELVNALTHGVGLVLSVAALITMVALSVLYGDSWHIGATSVYGASMVVLYAASTLYHWCSSPEWKTRLRSLDHAAIFLLIAGTYTPFTIFIIKGGLGWTLFGIAWGAAVLGSVLKYFYVDRYPMLSTFTYLGLGWLALLALDPLWYGLTGNGFFWLVAGGVAYTVGTIFYAWRTLPYHHSLWHCFVLAGSACHFLAVMESVVPWG